MTDKSKYKYSGLPLTPAAMSEIITSLYPEGHTFSRSSMLSEIIEYHKTNGGILSQANPSSQIKKMSI